MAYPGAQYDGRAANFAYAATIDVAKDGSAMRSYGVQFKRGHCSDGGTFAGYDIGNPGALISSAGQASAARLEKTAHIYTRRGRRVTGRARVALTVQFEGDQVDGTLTEAFRSRRVSCSNGPVRFRAYEDGTPQAPLADENAATGTYSGKARHGAWSLDVYLPWHVISLLKVHWVLECPGKNFLQSQTFYEIPIDGGDADGDAHFSYNLDGSQRLSGGLTERWGIGVQGTLNQYDQTEGGNQIYYSYEAGFSVGGSITLHARDGEQVGGACSGSSYLRGPGPRHVVLGEDARSLRPGRAVRGSSERLLARRATNRLVANTRYLNRDPGQHSGSGPDLTARSSVEQY